MKFPEMSRQGDPSHLSATARLVGARDEHSRLAAEADAVRGTPAEDAAASRVSAAAADVAAREAWVGWIEHGV
jgi:hypothetical protein